MVPVVLNFSVILLLSQSENQFKPLVVLFISCGPQFPLAVQLNPLCATELCPSL